MTTSLSTYRNRLALYFATAVALLIAFIIQFAPDMTAHRTFGTVGTPTAADDARASEIDVHHRIETDDPVVFVTIDDGYVASEEALDVARSHDMPVSLFLNEGPVRQHGTYFAEWIELGNVVHSHTLTHPNLLQQDAATQYREVCGMAEVLNDRFGATQAGSLFRAPYGASNDITALAASSCDLSAIVNWSGTIKDGQIELAVGDKLRPGDVLLTHFTNDLPENLRTAQETADAAGLTIARLEDYIR